MNGIQRNYDFVKSHQFKEASKPTLLIRKVMAEKNYAEFQKEHSALVEKMPAHRFKELDDMCGFVEGQYIEIITAIEERLKILRDAERRARERECANIPDPNENAYNSANVFDQNTRNYGESEILIQIDNENANQNANYQESGDLSANTEDKEERAIAKHKKRVKKVSTRESKAKRAKKERDSEIECEENSENEYYQENQDVTVQSAVVPVNNENDLAQQPDLRGRLNRFRADAREFLHSAERFRQEVLQVEHGNTIENTVRILMKWIIERIKERITTNHH